MIKDNPENNPNEISKYLKDNIPGILFGREVQYLYNTPKRLGSGLYLDLGTFQGLSAAALSKGLLDNKVSASVISVDTFNCDGVSRKYHPENYSKEIVETNLDQLGLLKKTSIYKLDFDSAAQFLILCQPKFIFLDGAHDYDSVLNDFQKWSPLLTKGGEFAFHDANVKSPNKQVWKLMEQLPDLGWEQVAEERTIMAWKKLND